MPQQKKCFSLMPVNNNTGGFSHRNGYPVIKFTIPAQDLLLETSSLRLTGKFLLNSTQGAVVATSGNATALQTEATADMTYATAPSSLALLTNAGGIHNCLDKITVNSKKSNIELVNQPAYASYVSQREFLTNNDEDYRRSPMCRSLASGNNANLSGRKLTISSPNNIGAGAILVPADKIGVDFSIPLNVAMLQAQDIHLGAEFVGGLNISLYLAPDESVLFNKYRKPLATQDISTSSYTLTNLRLEGRYLVPTPEELKAYMPTMIVEDRLNLINDIHSSVNSSAYTPQVQYCRGIVSVFQKDDTPNNYLANQANAPAIVGLSRVVQSKNGLRFPYDFPVDVKPNPYVNTDQPAGGAYPINDLQFKSLGLGDSEVRLHYQRALLGLPYLYHTSAGLKSAEVATQNLYAVADPAAGKGLNASIDVCGVGCDYSFGINLVQDFRNQDYAMELKTAVNTGGAVASVPGDFSSSTFIQNTYVRMWESFDLQKLLRVM
jgi:hypothetical protein